MCDGTIRRRRQKGKEEIFETIRTANFPKMGSDTKPQIQEAQRTPSRTQAKKTTPWHFIFKLE